MMLVKPVLFPLYYWENSITGFEYKLCGSRINRADAIKDLEIFLDWRLYFHHMWTMYFRRLWSLTRTVTFSSFDSTLMLYFAFVISKLDDPFAWIAFTSADASKTERIQQKFLALCYNRLFSQIYYSYASALNYQNLHTRRCH